LQAHLTSGGADAVWRRLQLDAIAAFNARIAALEATCDERAERRQAWASEIEALSSGKIKANVDLAVDISEARDAIDLLASKTRSQEATRLRSLDEAIEANPIAEVRQRLRTDCLMLLYGISLGSVWRR